MRYTSHSQIDLFYLTKKWGIRELFELEPSPSNLFEKIFAYAVESSLNSSPNRYRILGQQSTFARTNLSRNYCAVESFFSIPSGDLYICAVLNCGKIKTFVDGGDDSHKGWAQVNKRLIFQFVPVYGIAIAIPAFLTPSGYSLNSLDKGTSKNKLVYLGKPATGSVQKI